VKERDTTIISIRITKTLLAELDLVIPKTKRKTRNSWIAWAIQQGLRPHKKQRGKVE